MRSTTPDRICVPPALSKKAQPFFSPGNWLRA